MNKLSREVAIHVLIWMVFILIPFLLFQTNNFLSVETIHNFYLEHTIRISCVILLFYINYLFLIPNYFLIKYYGNFIFYNTVVVLFLLVVVGIVHASTLVFPPSNIFSILTPPFFNFFILALIIVVSIAVSISLFQKLKQSERNKTEVELNYIKSRLNPHFLFNTLNSIYALSVKKSDDTPDAIAKLSSIMRYVITESSATKVPLEKDISYINDFIDLQRYRLTNKTIVNFKQEGITAGKKIVPLLLISFVENAFKYGVSTDFESTILIFLSIRGDELNMTVENTKWNRKEEKEPGEKLGISSAKLLLEHFYFSKYSLTLLEESGSFNVNLKLDLG